LSSLILYGSDRQERVEKKSDGDTSNREREPLRIRLPGFVGDEEIGLGDVINRMTYAMGIKPCGGCEKRAATLNRWMHFTS
jgi:hypothetical protein